MQDEGNGSGVEGLEALVGTWTTDGSHPELPGAIHGQAAFEWLDGGRFLVWRAHYAQPEIPDALSVIGVTDDRLSMHYFDSRGIHRVYSVSMSAGTWRFWLEAPGFSQRATGIFSHDGNVITCHGQYSRDGASWNDDLELTYRRAG